MVARSIKYHVGKTIVNGIEYRKCRKCRKIKKLNLENFIKRATENGWRGECRVCFNAHQRLKKDMSPVELETGKRYRDKYKKEKPLQTLIKVARGNAKRRNKEFNISLLDLEFLWSEQSGLCAYTGRPMKFELGCEDSVSLDRIDSKIGYLKENIALCQWKVNIMKNNATVVELLEFCRDVIKTIT